MSKADKRIDIDLSLGKFLALLDADIASNANHVRRQEAADINRTKELTEGMAIDVDEDLGEVSLS